MRSQNLFIQIILIVLLALFCLLISCPPDRRPILQEALKNYKVNLGLDLRGGSELLYQVNPKDIDPTRSEEEVIAETIEVISQRIFESGIVKEPRIQRQGENRILIQLPDIDEQETKKIKEIIEQLGNLEFRLVASANVGAHSIEEENERATYERRKAQGGKSFELYKERLRKKGYQWFESRPDPKTGITSPDRLLLIEDGYDITGKKFANFSKDAGNDIRFELKSEAREDFKHLTENHKKELLAILFNNKVWASPIINSAIPSGTGVLEGFKGEELTELLQTLRSGSLEVQPELLHENTIGPSLGEDSIRRGIIAGLLGLTMVLVFMSIYYWGAGIIACLGLVFNIVIVFAILVIWRETLTLPGIGGLILTVGMSIDANIIIFERIREEKQRRWEERNDPGTSKKGRKKKDQQEEVEKDFSLTKEELLEHVNRGYQQAFSTIFDANVTTLLTAVILYYIATGAVQGFAFTMGWGVVVSFFTAIFVTRIFLSFLIEAGIIRQLKMFELVKNPQFKITQKMRLAGLASVAIIILGMTAFFYRGDSNYGLDLKGGVLAHISLQQPQTTDTVRERLNTNLRAHLKNYDETAEVQHIESRFKEGSSKDGWYEFSIRLRNLNEKEIEIVDADLRGISLQIRELHLKLTGLNQTRLRMLAKEREIRDSIRNLNQRATTGENVTTELERARQERRELHDSIKRKDGEREDILAEMEKLRSQRSDLILAKNKLSGVEQLRNAITEEFQQVLSPLPFGQLYKVRGDYTCALPVNVQTPVSLEFLEETAKESNSAGIWVGAAIGVDSYRVEFKVPESLDNPQQQIPALLQKHLELAYAELAKVPFDNLDQSAGKWNVVIQFAKPFPRTTMEKVLTTRCKFEEVASKIARPNYGDSYINAFTIFAEIAGGIRNDEEMSKIQEEIEKQLREKFETKKIDIDGDENRVYLSEPFPHFAQISAVVAEAAKTKAYRAILMALLMILLYIAVRFPNGGFRFGLGAVVALAHDVAVPLGAIAVCAHFGLVDVDISLPVIAALLTIVGYSLNDTIVIFDRIRENQRKQDMDKWTRLTREDVATVYNDSLNQTLSRTVLTSLTTLFVVTVIFLLNRGRGSEMEGFSFALIIGVIAGSYSSLFIASAIVLWLESRKRPSK